MRCCQTCGERAVPNHHAGFFTASKLYSPWITMPELAKVWLEAKTSGAEAGFPQHGARRGLQGRCAARGRRDSLCGRRELWEGVPDDVLVITAGVDVQPGGTASEGRLEVEVVAGGWRGKLVAGPRVFTGDPAQALVWNELTTFC